MSYLGLHNGIPPIKSGSGGTPSLTTQALDIINAYGASLWLPGDTSFEENKILSDGTGPLAVIGDPIGWVNDITGSYNLLQPTTSNKPVLTAPGNTWIFDGVNDRLDIDGLAITTSGPIFSVVAYRLPPSAPVGTQIILGYSGVGANRALYNYINSTAPLRTYVLTRDSASNALNSGGAGANANRANNEKIVVSTRKVGTSQVQNTKGDTVAANTDTVTNALIGTPSVTLGRFGVDFNATSTFNGEIYGGIMGNGAITAPEIEILENFLAMRGGFTLLP